MADKASIRKRAKNKKKRFALTALLPMARVGTSGKIRVDNIRTSDETVIFNVGGTHFEVFRSTLYKLPYSPLADDKLMKRHFRPEKGDYFFDRDPEVFKAVLNYLRVGELHIPRGLCGAAVKHELEYWGLEEAEIAECCWGPYSDWTSKLEVLQRLSRDQTAALEQTPLEVLEEEAEVTSRSKYDRMRQQAWRWLTMPESSRQGRVYAMLSLVFVCLSIFLFVAQTHEAFHVTIATNNAQNATPETDLVNYTSLPPTSANPTSLPSDVDTSALSAAQNTTLRVKGKTIVPDNTPQDRTRVHTALIALDFCCLVFFLADFLLRLMLAPHKLQHLVRPLTLMDGLALAPDLIELLYFLIRGLDPEATLTAAVPFYHVFRVLRVFRLMRHFPALWILFYTLKAGLYELLLLLLFLAVGMLVFGTLIYHADKREVFENIPLACWWAVITMTTVGYGDFYPTTNWGYFVGAMTGVAGLMMIGFTVPVLVENFLLFYSHTKSTAHLARQRVKVAHKLRHLKLKAKVTDKPDVNGNQAEDHVIATRVDDDVPPSLNSPARLSDDDESEEELIEDVDAADDTTGISFPVILPAVDVTSPEAGVAMDTLPSPTSTVPPPTTHLLSMV